MWKFAIVLLLVVYPVLGNSNCEGISDDKKIDCHINGEGNCEAAGCCWSPIKDNPHNYPWCFKGNGKPTQTTTPQPPDGKCANISDFEKLDCGKGSEDACHQSGCCWKPVQPNPSNLPWCYFKDKTVAGCSLSASPSIPFSDAEMADVQKYFEANLDIQGSGMVVAAPDHNTGPGGDYYFAWERDGALSMNALQLTAASFSQVEKYMDSWLSWVERSQKEKPVHEGCDILAEPKFVIPDGTPFMGGWCRPQNDGPGLRAITLMQLATNKPSVASRTWNSIKMDLDWVAEKYNTDGCDLWEEVKSKDFFWNRFTMRKALIQGAKFAQQMQDADRAAQYENVAKEIEGLLSDHVQSDGFVCEATNRCQDTSVIEAFNVGYNDDGLFAPLQKEVVATLAGLSKLYCKSYTLNQNAAAKKVPGVLFGRYAGDHYDGGNPWVLLTASAATLLYRQSLAVAKGTIPDADASSLLEGLLGGKVTAENLLGAGDAILNLMKTYLTNGMHMNEQIDRDTGILKSAKDLTWNYANVLKAMKARKNAAGALAAVAFV